jgi:hypothetical protein
MSERKAKVNRGGRKEYLDSVERCQRGTGASERVEI